MPPILAQWLRPHQREGVQFCFECVYGLKDYGGCGAILIHAEWALTAAHWMLNHASVDVALFDGRQTLLASASAGSATTPAGSPGRWTWNRGLLTD